MTETTITIKAGDSLVRALIEAGHPCPRCGWRVAAGYHGWVEADGVYFAAPCPACSPVSNERCDDERCDHDEPSTCSYCDEPVDEENETVFYSTAFSADHYDCVPLSEKVGA